MFNYIFFDFDGTLADSSQCAVKATQKAFASMNLIPPSEANIIDRMGIPIEISFFDLGAKHVSQNTFNTLLTSFRQYYKELADYELYAFPGAVELLKILKNDLAKHLQIALVTSKKTDVAIRNAQSLGLSAYLDVVIGSDKVTQYKPDPEGIFVALQHFHADRLRPLNALMVGDSIFDIQMGQKAKIETCGVTWGAHSADKLQSAKPNYLVHNFKELLDILML